MINHVRINYEPHPSMKDFKELTVPEAKKACMAKWGKLPRCGCEMVAAEQKHQDEFTFKCTGYTTYLVNEGGTFRVWTYFR